MKKILSILFSMTMLIAVCFIHNTTVSASESDSKTTTDLVALSDELQTLENEANGEI